jgi:hypothetical protein
MQRRKIIQIVKVYIMRNILKSLLFLTLTILFAISCADKTKEKELNLKERELSIKEKELALKSDSINKIKGVVPTQIKLDKNSESEIKSKLPFVGQKFFQMYPGSTGTGTPQYYVEISENGKVMFGYFQRDHSAETGYKMNEWRDDFGTYFFNKIFKVKYDFSDSYTYYKIDADKVYEVDENGKLLFKTDCCEDYESKKPCPCAADIFAN